MRRSFGVRFRDLVLIECIVKPVARWIEPSKRIPFGASPVGKFGPSGKGANKPAPLVNFRKRCFHRFREPGQWGEGFLEAFLRLPSWKGRLWGGWIPFGRCS